MGVPKFFRWLSERYPCICEDLKEYQIPEFDNLYFDMNGIIHNCSHPNDFDPHFRISEEQIFTDIFHYIEVLFRLIRPKKLFFMAVDGVAPRAKMNQQRGRRFSSAKEAEVLEKKALEKGEDLPKEKRFDSNCITPGTQFMAKLQEQLKYFVSNKISTDKLWQKPTVILSGHSVPGEGEHKIMDYIRFLRSQPDWDPLTRHCLYGLDADLIILGLCTHEPNLSLLREEVKFVKNSKNKSISTPETTNYVLLQLSLLRGYLDLEFQILKKQLPFPYDIEKIIDDWVLLGFLVGNDFIPHLPHLHIHCNALGILYDTYRAVMPKLDGYINESGVLNMARFEQFLIELSEYDKEQFSDTYADMKYFESKTGRKLFPELDVQVEEGGRKMKIDEAALRALIEKSELEMFEFGDEREELDQALEPNGLETINAEEEDDKLFFKEFTQHKRDYYMNKMGYPSVDNETLKREAEGYVTALQWILFYYYRGCSSWSWYYPHHYSPYVSDLRGFASLDVRFNLGTPFLPFQQLLSVLPAASKDFLPKVFQELMVSKDSPIIDYFPGDFKSDLNGKRNEWEAVVLIPFIEEKRMLDAMAPYMDELTPEEKARNSHGPMHIYKYTPLSLGKYSSPKYFPEISSNHASCVEAYPSDIVVPVNKLISGRHPKLEGTKSIYVQGFPVLSALEITGKLEKRAVKVFEQPSRNENMILRIKTRPEMRRPLDEIARDFFTRDYVYCSYPHLTPARVKMLVSQSSTALHQSKDRNKEDFQIQQNNSSAQTMWHRKLSSLKEHYLTKFGIDLDDCSIIVYAEPLEGIKLAFTSSGNAFNEMIWSKEVVGYPLDSCLKEVNEMTKKQKKMHLKDVFPPGTLTFMIGPMDYGCSAIVNEVDPDGKIVIHLTSTTEPDLTLVRRAVDSSFTSYYPGYVCAGKLGISSHLFARITSGIIVQSPHTDSDKVNIGLNIKSTKSNKQMIGFTKKIKNDKHWLYSDKAVDLVREYMDTFPDLIQYLAENIQEEMFFKDHMFPNDKDAARLVEIRAWLKTLDKGEMRSVDSELLEPGVVKVLETTLSSYEQHDLVLRILRLGPHHLYLPKPELMVASPDPDAEHDLLDRIVYVRECHSIPIGTKGTIIGIEKKVSKSIVCEGTGWEEAATLYDVIFDKEIIGGQALFGCSKKLVYRLNKQVFINISYGARKAGILNKEVFGKRVDTNRNSNKANNRIIDSMMPSFNQAGTGGGGGRKHNNRNQPASSDPISVNDEGSPAKPSGSVTNFFNAYRNSITNESGEVGGKSGQNRLSGRTVLPQTQPQSKLEGTDLLADMWNLLKNIQENNTDVSEKDIKSPSEETPASNSDVILTQTFTRSTSSQETMELQVQPKISQQPPTLNIHRDDIIGQQTVADRQPNITQNIPIINNQNNAGMSGPANAPCGNPNQFFEQTEALKKILCINADGNAISDNNNGNLESSRVKNQQNRPREQSRLPGVSDFSSRSCGHLPTCMEYFTNLCSINNITPSLFTFNSLYNQSGVICFCSFELGTKPISLKSDPKPKLEEAREDVACKGIKVLKDFTSNLPNNRNPSNLQMNRSGTDSMPHQVPPPRCIPVRILSPDRVPQMDRRQMAQMMGGIPPPNSSIYQPRPPPQSWQNQRQPQEGNSNHQTVNWRAQQQQGNSNHQTVNWRAPQQQDNSNHSTDDWQSQQHQSRPPPPQEWNRQEQQTGEVKKRRRPQMRLAAKFHNPPVFPQ